MPQAALVAGRAAIYVDGAKKFVGDSISYTTDDTKREDSVGKSGVAGFTEEPVAPKVSVELIDLSDQQIDELNSVRNATIVLELLNGAVHYTYPNAWRNGDPIEKNENARATVEFHSKTCKKTKG